MRGLLVFSVVVALAGCENGYSKFYRPYQGATPELIAKVRASPAPTIPILEHSNAKPDDVLGAYVRNGYMPIGYSSFNSGQRAPDSEALSQAKGVGADLVVVFDPQYTGSITTSIPITTPTSTTSYSQGNATAYGAGGVVNAYGNSTTTTYGSQTTYVPMTVHRFDYGAVFLVRRTWVLGANMRDLTDAERGNLGSNKGVYISLVVNNTPAYLNDILVGDLILSINREAVFGVQSAQDLLQKYRGQSVEITLLRKDQTLSKTLTLAP